MIIVDCHCARTLPNSSPDNRQSDFAGRLFRLFSSVLRRPVYIVMLVLSGLLLPGLAAATSFLSPDEAFRPEVTMRDATTIQVHYAIADGYYMYREHFAFAIAPPASQGTGSKALPDEPARIATAVFPAADHKFDPTFNRDMEIYHHAVDITIPVMTKGEFVLAVTGQGCSEKGVCYPPKTIHVTLSPARIGPSSASWLGHLMAPGSNQGAALSGPANSASVATEDSASHQSQPEPASSDRQSGAAVSSLLAGSNLLWIACSMFVIGLGLSLTPCVYPLIPILSSIIVGRQAASQQHRGRSFSLALVYVLGMATVNTLLGVAAALAGRSLVAYLQNPWFLSVFALLLVVLALSMFGWYELSLPSAWQQRIDNMTRSRQGGKLGSVFVMGALSALMVGPCVTPALAGTLSFIGQSGQVSVGALALFSMSIGMGVPLLLIGLAAGTILPKAGAWMDGIKRLFGVVMLGAALWIVYPVLPGFWSMLGWMLLCLGSGAYLIWAVRPWWLYRGVAVLLLMAAAAQGAGALTGATDPFRPLAAFSGMPVSAAGQSEALLFSSVKSVTQLDQALAARTGISLLDFSADWCIDCRELERYTFPDKKVQQSLAGISLYRADVTENTTQDQALMKRFGLYGPPAIIFIGPDGQEIAGSRLVGFMDAQAFRAAVDKVRKNSAPH